MNSLMSDSEAIVVYLRQISPEYGCDLNQLPIFEVMMRLRQEDRDRLEDILFGEWTPSNER